MRARQVPVAGLPLQRDSDPAAGTAAVAVVL